MSSSAKHGRTITTGPVVIDESLTASQLRGLVGDHQILVSYDGGTKFGILGEDFDGDTFPVRKLQARHGLLTDDWESMDRHYFVVEGPYRDPEAGDRGKADITEDLTEAQLAEASFSTEIVVSWADGGQLIHGIIVGYQYPNPGEKSGVFLVDMVEDSHPWAELGGPTCQLKRGEFVVFGPANRDPGDGPGASDDLSNMGHGHGWVPEEGPLTVVLPTHAQDMLPYLLCTMDIMAMETEVGQPTFKVRLDTRPRPFGGHRFRVGVQPVEQPIMHDEIYDVLMVASKYNLSVSTSSSGLDITTPEDAV